MEPVSSCLNFMCMLLHLLTPSFASVWGMLGVWETGACSQGQNSLSCKPALSGTISSYSGAESQAYWSVVKVSWVPVMSTKGSQLTSVTI